MYCSAYRAGAAAAAVTRCPPLLSWLGQTAFGPCGRRARTAAKTDQDSNQDSGRRRRRRRAHARTVRAPGLIAAPLRANRSRPLLCRASPPWSPVAHATRKAAQLPGTGTLFCRPGLPLAGLSLPLPENPSLPCPACPTLSYPILPYPTYASLPLFFFPPSSSFFFFSRALV